MLSGGVGLEALTGRPTQFKRDWWLLPVLQLLSIRDTDVTSGGGLSGSIGTAVRPITAVRCLLGSQATGTWNRNGSVGGAQSNDHDLASCFGTNFQEVCPVGHLLQPAQLC